MIGQGVALAAMPLLAASLTRDPLGVSLVTVATYAASLVVGLPAGALVDRWPLRPTMVWADTARAVVLLSLTLSVVGVVTSLPLITLAAFALATGRDFSDVSPVYGVFVGSGGTELEVEVDVVPVTAPSSEARAAKV